MRQGAEVFPFRANGEPLEQAVVCRGEARFGLNRVDHEAAFFGERLAILDTGSHPTVDTGQKHAKVQVEIRASGVLHKAVNGGLPILLGQFERHLDVHRGGEGGFVDLGHPFAPQVFVQTLRSSDTQAFHVVSAAEVVQGPLLKIKRSFHLRL